MADTKESLLTELTEADLLTTLLRFLEQTGEDSPHADPLDVEATSLEALKLLAVLLTSPECKKRFVGEKGLEFLFPTIESPDDEFAKLAISALQSLVTGLSWPFP